MEKLYSNVGEKLQLIAKVVGVLGIIVFAGCVLLELFTGFDEFGGILLLVGLASGFVLIVNSWVLYAFGQITEDVHKISSYSLEKNDSYDSELPEI